MSNCGIPQHAWIPFRLPRKANRTRANTCILVQRTSLGPEISPRSFHFTFPDFAAIVASFPEDQLRHLPQPYLWRIRVCVFGEPSPPKKKWDPPPKRIGEPSKPKNWAEEGHWPGGPSGTAEGAGLAGTGSGPGSAAARASARSLERSRCWTARSGEKKTRLVNMKKHQKPGFATCCAKMGRFP